MAGERSSATSLMGGMPLIVESAEAVAPKKGRSPLQEWAQEVLAARKSGNERRFVNAQIIYGGLMMARCAESSHEIVIEPMSNGQSSILSSSVSVVEIGPGVGRTHGALGADGDGALARALRVVERGVPRTTH